MNVTLRVDASRIIGIGHLIRCRTLAQALQNRGANVQFICRAHAGHGIEILRDSGLTVAELPAPAVRSGESVGIDYACWLGVSQACDANESIAALRNRPGWLVVDHYGLGAEWEQRLRPHVGRILVIDDLANRAHDCDALLDQNYSPDAESRYAGLLPAGTARLLGPDYALLRPEYAERRNGGDRHSGRIDRVLVFFGGADPETGQRYVFLTNHFGLAAKTIADIYKARWQIELFFKAIKQNLKIKTFVGTSRNAVMTQIWIAMCVYLLLAFLKFQSQSGQSIQQILRVLQLNLFEKRELMALLRGEPPSNHAPPNPNQLALV